MTQGARRLSISVVTSGICFWLVSGSFALGQVPTVRADFPAPDSEVAITQWQLLGPFPFDKKDLTGPDAEQRHVGINRDYLQDLGQDEASMDAVKFAELKTPKAGVTLDRRFRNVPISATPKTNILELADRRKSPFDYVVAYLAVVVESTKDQDIVIAAGVDDSMQVRLNQELLFADKNTADHFMKKFQRFIGARLKKGSNFLLVKVGNIDRDWRLIVTLYPQSRALELARDNGVNPILLSSVVTKGQPLQLRGDLLTTPEPARLEITDAHHAVVESGELDRSRTSSRPLDKLGKNGLYYCRVMAGGEKIERPFYYGDLDAGYQEMEERSASVAKTSEPVAIDLQAQMGRLKHLLKEDSRTSESWDQKVAASFAELEDNFASVKVGTDSFLHSAGTHIRGYRSSVDGQVQHYWLHVPEKPLQAGKPVPVVVVLPWTSPQNLPFLESYYMAAFDENERYRVLGDDYGFAVLQVWSRGNFQGGTAIGTTDVFEALESIGKDYPIDPARIYLLGYCEAGRQALLLAERFPDRFAAASVEGPITVVKSRSPLKARWDEYGSPVSGVESLVNVPIFITHDEEDNPPIQDSVNFASRGKEAGVTVTLVSRQGGGHGFFQNPMAVKRSLFEFLNGKQRNSAPSKVASKQAKLSFGIGHGPIEDAFGAPVLIVEGTTGTSTQKTAVHELVERLKDEWKKSYFVDCPVRLDTQINDADIQKFNLVMVGDKETNSLFARLSEHLQVHATKSSLSLAGKDYSGTRLGYEFIVPNPLSRGKYLVGIGMNDWTLVKDWNLHPALDGIFDFFVVDLSGSRPRFVDAGYFDAPRSERTASASSIQERANQ